LFSAFISLALSTISYQFPRIFLILFLPFLFFYYRKAVFKKHVPILIFLYILLFLFSLNLIISGGARATQTSIFSTPDVKLVLNEAIGEGHKISPILTRIFQNKPIYFGRALIDNYFSYFNFDFLFLQTVSPVREVVRNTGFLYLIEFPFLIFGAYQILIKKIRWGIFTLGWILIVPFALSPFIYESPNIHRYLLSILPLEIIIAFGITEFFQIIRVNRKIFKISVVILLLVFVFQFTNFLVELFIYQPVHKPWTRNHPYKQLISDLNKLAPLYNKIAISTSDANVYMYYLFYNKVNPKTYQSLGSHGNEDFNNIGKYYFIHLPCAENKPELVHERHVLFVNQATCGIPFRDYKVIKKINWGDGNPALVLTEYAP
jgi:hypothetical protein